MEEEEEGNWLTFKCREKKAEMIAKEGMGRQGALVAAAPQGLYGSGLSQGRIHSSES